MGPIRSPLGAMGAILVLLEGIAGASLFALDSDPNLRLAMVVTIIFVLVLITLTVLGVIIYFTVTNPGFLFNPADVGKLGETAQHRFLTTSRHTVVEQKPPEPVTSVSESSGRLSLMADTQDHPDDDSLPCENPLPPSRSS